MELTINNGSKAAPDDVLGVLRESTPFGGAPDELLRKIAAIARRAQYAAGRAHLQRRRGGRRHLRRGERPDRAHLHLGGRCARAAQAHDARAACSAGRGSCSASTQRLATVTALEPAELIRIDTEALVKVLEAEPAPANAVMEPVRVDDRARVHACRSSSRRCAGSPASRSPRRCRASSSRCTARAVAEEPAAVPDADRASRCFLGSWYLTVEVWKLPRFREMPGITDGGEGVAEPQPGLRALDLHARSTTRTSGSRSGASRRRSSSPPCSACRSACFLGWSRKFKEYVFPVFETAAADPDPRLGAAGDRDVHRDRVGGDLPRLPRLVLRHRAEHHARRASRSTSRTCAPRTASARASGRCSATSSCRARCRSSSPACRSRSACPGSRWSRPRWCRASTASGYVINTSYMMVRYPTIVIGMITLGVRRLRDERPGADRRRLHDAVARARARALGALTMDMRAAGPSGSPGDPRPRSGSTTSSRSTTPKGRRSWPWTTARSTSRPARSA